MRLVGSAENVQEGGLGSHSQRPKFQRDISATRTFPLRCVESTQQNGIPSIQHQSWKGTQITPSCEKQQGFCLHGDMTGDTESLLKGQCTKFHLQPLILGSGRGRAEWNRGDPSGGYGVGGSGERTKGTAARIPVLSFPILQESSLSGRALPSKCHQPERKK